MKKQTGNRMETSELKIALHRFIDQIQDPSVLQAVHILLSKQLASESDFWDELSTAQREDIEAGLTDLEAGKSKNFKDVLRNYE
jgi:hypothetical protein